MAKQVTNAHREVTLINHNSGTSWDFTNPDFPRALCEAHRNFAQITTMRP